MGRVTADVRGCCRSGRTGARRSSTPPGGKGSARRGTRRCSTESARGARAPPVAPAALLAVDGPLPGPRAHCAKRLQARDTRDAGTRLPRVQRRAPAPDDPTTATVATRMPARHRQWLARAAAGARGAGAGQVQDALRPAVRAGALDGPRRGGRHVTAGAARRPDRLRGRHCRLRAGDRQLLRPAPLPPQLAGAAGAPPPTPLAGFTVEAAPPPGDLGAALVGRTVL